MIRVIPIREVLQIPLEDLVPNQFQTRLDNDESTLMTLITSVRQHGIIQPLIVRRQATKFEIIAGERRYRAAMRAGLTKVPALVIEVDDKTSAELTVIENIQHRDLTPIEEAQSYQKLIVKQGLSQAEVAQDLGISQTTVAAKIKLLSLADSVQKALHNGKISERHARSLLKITSLEEQTAMLTKIIKERMTVKQLDEHLKGESSLDDDVPLVSKEPDIEAIKAQATDIISPSSKTGKPSFELIEEDDKPQPTSQVKLFDDVELLEVDDSTSIKSEN